MPRAECTAVGEITPALEKVLLDLCFLRYCRCSPKYVLVFFYCYNISNWKLISNSPSSIPKVNAFQVVASLSVFAEFGLSLHRFSHLHVFKKNR